MVQHSAESGHLKPVRMWGEAFDLLDRVKCFTCEASSEQENKTRQIVKRGKVEKEVKRKTGSGAKKDKPFFSLTLSLFKIQPISIAADLFLHHTF